MKLSIDQIKSVTQGAVSVFEVDDNICFRRFTAEQEELYRITNEEFWKKTFSTAGVKLCFQTDSEHLDLAVLTLESSSRTYFSIDVLVNEEYIDSLKNFREEEMNGDYTKNPYPLGHFEKRFELGTGMKTVTMYFPWSVEARIEALCLDDNTKVIPVRPDKTMLVFGDSITHGYDAKRTMNRYVVQAANALHAEEVNKAIGGEVFFPELAAIRESYDPDYILVAYGSNDWGKTTWDQFAVNCPKFYETLAELYPSSKIFALAPIWRKDHEEVRECCDFRRVAEYIQEATKPFSNITVIDCFDFIPKDVNYFADFKLHPNDEGFAHYGKNLILNLL